MFRNKKFLSTIFIFLFMVTILGCFDEVVDNTTNTDTVCSSPLTADFTMATETGGTGSRSLASDGTSIYLYKHDYPGAPSAKIWKIDPSTGAITATYYLTLSFGETNQISWVGDMTWHNGALWATGAYASAPNTLQEGIFRINLTTGLSENQIPVGPDIDVGGAGLKGLASDGVNFYVGVDLMGAVDDLGWIKFNPDTNSIVPSSPFFLIGSLDAFDDVTYGDGYLWTRDFNIDASTGTVITEYCVPGDDGLLYLNNMLWRVEDTRLMAITAP